MHKTVQEITVFLLYTDKQSDYLYLYVNRICYIFQKNYVANRNAHILIRYCTKCSDKSRTKHQNHTLQHINLVDMMRQRNQRVRITICKEKTTKRKAMNVFRRFFKCKVEWKRFVHSAEWIRFQIANCFFQVDMKWIFLNCSRQFDFVLNAFVWIELQMSEKVSTPNKETKAKPNQIVQQYLQSHTSSIFLNIHSNADCCKRTPLRVKVNVHFFLHTNRDMKIKRNNSQ